MSKCNWLVARKGFNECGQPAGWATNPPFAYYCKEHVEEGAKMHRLYPLMQWPTPRRGKKGSGKK